MVQQVVDIKAAIRLVRRWATSANKAYFDFLAKLPTWGFILAVAAWTVLFKTALVPLVAVLNDYVFAPLGLATIFSHEPILEVADYVTKTCYDWQLFSWSTLSTVIHLLFIGLLFPLAATGIAQVIPQYSLAKKIPSERRRAAVAVLAMGLVYMLAYGEVALLISGSVIAIPLVLTFAHRLNKATLQNAYLITTGIHAVANSFIVLFRGLLGGN